MATAEKPVISKYRDRMDKTVQALKEEFASLRTGRATAGLLDQVMVEAYGSRTPITQVGSVSVPDPRSITVSVWDKGLVVSVEKAIRNSGLGFNPVVEGTNLRIPIPPLTEERRKEFVKIVKSRAEDARVAVRNVRRFGKDSFDALKSEVGEDELARAEKELDAVTKQFIEQIDDSLKHKEAELLEI